jgi:hypothetical protein
MFSYEKENTLFKYQSKGLQKDKKRMLNMTFIPVNYLSWERIDNPDILPSVLKWVLVPGHTFSFYE